VATPVLDRPSERLDDSGLPPLPPEPDGGEGPSWHGPAQPHLFWVIAWTVMLVFALPASWAIVTIISHAS
jgi:hypothetical protein